MSSDPSKASRFGSSKVRTGCLTCVRRRIKCGEEKPVCSRCVKSGRECIRRNEGRNEGMRMVCYVATPVRDPGLLPGKERIELRCLEYFRLRTAPELAGVHDPDLWTNFVMQIAVANPAIWHATVALGALHERFEESEGMSLRDGDLAVALTHYGKAIHHLCAELRKKDCQAKELPLIACALFCAFESMGYHLHSALSHVTSGLRVLAERKINERTSDSLDLLSPLFTRLDTQRLELGDSSFPTQLPLVLLPQVDYGVLGDLNDARMKIDRVLNSLLHHIRKLKHRHEDGKPAENQQVGSAITDTDPIHDYLQWASALDHLLQDLKSDEVSLPSALVLQVWRTYINMMLRIGIQEGEMGFDAFLDDFAIMISLAEEFLCWSVKHGGPAENLFPLSDWSLLDEAMPEELQHQHRGYVDEVPQWCGFMGMQLEDPIQRQQVDMEAVAALETAKRLLTASSAARAQTFGSSTARRSFKPTYTYAHGVVYLLYVTVSRCRDPGIRRKAWSILHKCNRREGLWDSALAARLGQRLIGIEEGQARQDLGCDMIENASQIPNCARVRIIRPTFLPDKRSIERYYFGWRGSLDEAIGEEQVWVEEGMEW